MTAPPIAPARRPPDGIPSRAAQQASFEAYRTTGDTAIRDRLIEEALPLAHQVARRYQRSSESLDDLVQVARLGLVKAVERFDASRGVAFSTYAVPTMVGEIKRYFRDTGWALHVPRSLQERVFRVEQAERTLTARCAPKPTVEQLAEEAEMSVEDVLGALEAANAYDARSLEAPAPGDDEGGTYMDSLGCDEESYELVEDRATISVALRCLPLRERRVLHMRFIDDLTQSEIAERMGVSQMQISRLIRRSLQRLRDETSQEAPLAVA